MYIQNHTLRQNNSPVNSKSEIPLSAVGNALFMHRELHIPECDSSRIAPFHSDNPFQEFANGLKQCSLAQLHSAIA
jgi:hypothetical protein